MHPFDLMQFTRAAAFVPIGLVAVLVAPIGATENGATTPNCAWEVEYNLSASLKLTETPMGEGNGVYAIGPGEVVLRYENSDVKMLSYAMRESFTVKAKTLVWTTTVITDTNTFATPNACSIAAEGALDGHVVRWRTPVRLLHTDGTLTCNGSLCGKFGAPPAGKMALHIGPLPVRFSPFEFAPDMKTFTMATTPISKTTMPKQTGEIALAGREVRRVCVPVVPCTDTSGR